MTMPLKNRQKLTEAKVHIVAQFTSTKCTVTLGDENDTDNVSKSIAVKQ